MGVGVILKVCEIDPLRSISHGDFSLMYMKAFIKILVQIGKIFSKEIRFEFLYVYDIGPRSRNDLDLGY